jgi:hypothetical protein
VSLWVRLSSMVLDMRRSSSTRWYPDAAVVLAQILVNPGLADDPSN